MTGILADLLVWNTTTWVYLVGPKTLEAVGVYPEVAGTTSDSIYPGGRYSAQMWYDSNSDSLWLFGGYGRTNDSTTAGWLSDMWKFSLATNQWTFVGGSLAISQNGDYINTPVPTPTAAPVDPPTTAPIQPPLNAPQQPPVQPPVEPPVQSPIEPPIEPPIVPEVPIASPSANNSTVTSDLLKTDAKIAIGVVVPGVAIGVGLLVLLLLLNRRKKAGKKTTVAVPLVDASNGHYNTITVAENFSNYANIPKEGSTSDLSKTESYVSGADNRLIPYASVSLEKEIGVGSFGKGKNNERI